jgi:HTH-type transcriptional regulator/antitoxin HigA
MSERRPAEVFHPGEYLLDELNARGWTQTEFAEIVRRPVKSINEIINGKKGITPETAREIAAAFGEEAETWMNLDTAYNLWKVSGEAAKDVSKIAHRAKMSTKYPVRDMTLRQWLVPSEENEVIETQLLRWFEIRSLDETPKLGKLQFVRTRKSGSDEEEITHTQVAWLYRVKHIADSMPVSKYSEKKLRVAVEQLKQYREFVEEIRHIPQLLEECGVRFVVVEPLPSSKIDGVCLWLDENSPVIGMTLRFDRIDNFWFVLRHEIEHVLNGDGKGGAILDSDMEKKGDKSISEQERIANEAAAEFCTPQAELTSFIDRKYPIYTKRDLILFAKTLKLHPGLVAGQFRKKTGRYEIFTNFVSVPVREFITTVAMADGFGNILPVQI